jgi:hypothetical protein
VREHYLTPLVTTSLNLPGSEWTLGQWWTKDGTVLSQATMRQVNRLHVSTARSKRSGREDTGLRHRAAVPHPAWTKYQSGSRFWPFQWIESGWLLALSVLPIAATIWLVRRRVL